MKINLLSIILIGLLLLSGWFYIQQKKELSNARDIISVQTDNIMHYKTNKDGTKSAINNTIVVDKSNIKALVGKDKNLINQIGKVSNLQSLVKTTYQIKDSFVVKLKDSLIFIDSLTIEKIKYFDYQDKFLILHAEEIDSSIRFSYYYQDSVSIILYKQPLGRWYEFWKWGKKKYLTNVTFKNPKAEAIKVESIIIK